MSALVAKNNCCGCFRFLAAKSWC